MSAPQSCPCQSCLELQPCSSSAQHVSSAGNSGCSCPAEGGCEKATGAWLDSSGNAQNAAGQPLLISSLPTPSVFQDYMDFLAQRSLLEDRSLCTTVYHTQQSRADTPSLRDSNSFACVVFVGFWVVFFLVLVLVTLCLFCMAGITVQGGSCRDCCAQGRFAGTEWSILWVGDGKAKLT